MITPSPQITAPGLGGIDLSTLSWEDYLLIGIGGMMFTGLLFPSVFESKPKGKRKPVKASTGFAGGIVTVLVLAGGGYAAYRYFNA